MNSWIKHPARVLFRIPWLTAELAFAAAKYAAGCAFGLRKVSPAARANWLRGLTKRILRVFSMDVQIAGPLPQSGLLVSNHLGYLDIIVLASLTPCVFVAKHDVARWPVFGWFARVAGTVFVNREKRTSAAQTASEIEAALRTGLLIVLFPEGTSSGGETVLPFKSSLLEPAARSEHALTAGFISYDLPDGDVSEEVCYWKDMTLVPHLVNLLAKRRVHASVRFTAQRGRSQSRKELARQLHSEILHLKEQSLGTASA